MVKLSLFDVDTHVVAKTYIAPSASSTIVPDMKGVVVEHEEIVQRHKIRFENGREVWATSDQIKLDPDFVEQKEKPSEEEKE